MSLGFRVSGFKFWGLGLFGVSSNKAAEEEGLHLENLMKIYSILSPAKEAEHPAQKFTGVPKILYPRVETPKTKKRPKAKTHLRPTSKALDLADWILGVVGFSMVTFGRFS